MEYVYSALVLHAAKKEISEANVKGVLTAAGVTADETRVKALVGSLDGVDIEAAIKTAAMAAAPAAAAPAGGDEKKEKKEKKEEVSEDEAAAGLGALFG